MKKGISIWAFGAMPLEEAFAMAKDAGYDGVELALEYEGPVSMKSTKEDAENVKALAKKYGIELYTLASSICWDSSLTANDENLRNTAMQQIKKQIELASMLGCDTVLIVPGTVKVDFAPELGNVDYDVAYARALDAMRALAPYAEKHGITIAMENVWTKFLVSPIETAKFIDEIGSDYVGSYFDVGNVLYCGVPEQWIRILNKRIKKIHIKDYSCATHSFVGLFQGDVDYPAVMDALDKIGYDGWITSEVIIPGKCFPEMLIYNTSKSMDKLIKR